MSDGEMEAKIAVNLITELFKEGFKGLKSFMDWAGQKSIEHDVFFGICAKAYGKKNN